MFLTADVTSLIPLAIVLPVLNAITAVATAPMPPATAFNTDGLIFFIISEIPLSAPANALSKSGTTFSIVHFAKGKRIVL